MKFCSKIILTLFVILIPSFMFANNNKALFDMLYSYSKNNPNKLNDYIQKITKEITSANDEERLNILNLFIGRYYNLVGNKTQAIEYMLKAKLYFEKKQNNDFLPITYMYLGSLYRHFFDINSSLEYYYKAMSISSIDSSIYSWCLNHLGDIHLLNFKNKKEKIYLDSAKYYYEKSNLVAKRNDNNQTTFIIANNFNNLGDVYFLDKDYELALFYTKESLVLTKKNNDLGETIENYTDIAKCYIKLNNPRNALQYFYNALSDLNGSNINYEEQNAFQMGVDIFTFLNKPDSVAKYSLKLYETAKKMIFDQEIDTRKMYEVEEAKNKLEFQNQQLKDKEYFSNLINYFLIAITFLTIVILYFIWNKFTSKKKENKELQKAYDQIKELNATKDKFFSIIAHDLKGPVGSMKSLLDLMISDFDKFTLEDINQILSEFKGQTDSTLSLLMNLLDWSRSQRGTIKYDYHIVNLNTLISSNILLLSGLAGDKKIYLQNKLKTDFQIFADPNSISTVLRNLISNSIKYSKPNTTIDIGIESIDDKFATVYVRDYGVGMSDEQASALFNLKVNNSTYGTNNEKGTGLGLLICKDFVENNFGKIWVKSSKDVGSTFYFTVKLSENN